MQRTFCPPKAYGIIPARYASTRFPGKPLLPLHGKPMFLHVWERASRCPLLESVTLATDDERIRMAAEQYGVPCVMTAQTHESGTDRVYEAARVLKLPADSLVVNVQGDEPALDPNALTALIRCFSDASVQVATLAHPLKKEDLHRPDKVKVVTAANGDALYFSRSPLPFARDKEYAYSPLGHVGLYAFSMPALKRFVGLAPSSLEMTERLEQLRLLENGIPIRVAVIESGFQGVDSESDVPAVLALLQK